MKIIRTAEEVLGLSTPNVVLIRLIEKKDFQELAESGRYVFFNGHKYFIFISDRIVCYYEGDDL
jgi:hypothetical protein